MSSIATHAVIGVMHYVGDADGRRLPHDEPRFFAAWQARRRSRPPRSVAAVTFPPDWQEAISYRPLAGPQVSCERGIAFVDLPSTLVWFDEAGRHQESLESERPLGEQLLTHFTAP